MTRQENETILLGMTGIIAARALHRSSEPVIVSIAREALLGCGHSLAELAAMPASDLIKLASQKCEACGESVDQWHRCDSDDAA